MGDSAAAAVADVTAAQLAAMTPEAQWLIQHGVPIAILPALEQAMNTRLANERAQLNAQYDAQLAAELAKKAEDDRRLESIAERIGDRLASSVTTALQPLTACVEFVQRLLAAADVFPGNPTLLLPTMNR
jgi:hypothetical protein